jgi:integrase
MLTEELDNFIDWYKGRVLRTKGRAPARSTLESKRSRLSTVCNTGGLPGLQVLGTLVADRAEVECLLDKLALRMSPGAMRHCVDVLRDFVPYAVAQGWLPSLACCVITQDDTPPRNPQKPITVYTLEEVELLLASARGRSLRWWAFLTTVADTGRRVGEVLGLRWEWLRLDVDTPYFDLPTSKNKRQQYVPLTKRLRSEVFTPEHVAQLRTENVSRFRTGDPAEQPFPWSYSSVEKMFARHCARLDITDRGFHCLRHTKATSLLAKGVPIQAVSALLGHASVQTTDRTYSHVTALDFARYID